MFQVLFEDFGSRFGEVEGIGTLNSVFFIFGAEGSEFGRVEFGQVNRHRISSNHVISYRGRCVRRPFEGAYDYIIPQVAEIVKI